MDDLARLPDDGSRYELVDGRLEVNPAPKPIHGRAEHRLAMHLETVCTDAFEIFQGAGIDVPFPVRLVPHWLVVDGPWKQRIGG